MSLFVPLPDRDAECKIGTTLGKELASQTEAHALVPNDNIKPDYTDGD